MNKEKIATSVLYVASIVLAIGIGAWQVGPTSSGMPGGVANCDASGVLQYTCKLFEPNKSSARCSASAMLDAIDGAKPYTMIVGAREGAVLCSGCPETYNAYEDQTGEEGCVVVE